MNKNLIVAYGPYISHITFIVHLHVNYKIKDYHTFQHETYIILRYELIWFEWTHILIYLKLIAIAVVSYSYGNEMITVPHILSASY